VTQQFWRGHRVKIDHRVTDQFDDKPTHAIVVGSFSDLYGKEPPGCGPSYAIRFEPSGRFSAWWGETLLTPVECDRDDGEMQLQKWKER
jgi:hypothetical protein